MKILLSSFVYYPEPIGLHEHDLASGLVNLGHDVFVITGFPSYPAGIVYEGYQDKAGKWETVDGVKIYRVPFIGNRSRSPVKRIFSFFTFLFLTLEALYSQKIKPDIIRANQFGLPGFLISKFQNIPFYLDVGDLWPDWAKTSSFGISNFLYDVLDWQQKIIYKRACKITTISKSFKHFLELKGVPANKIYIFPSWASGNNFKVVPRNLEFGIRENLTGKFNIIYAGNIGSAQGLDIVVKCAMRLEKESTLQFTIIGDGLEKEGLEREVNRLKLENVKFLGKKDPEQLVDYFAWADFLFLPLGKDPIYELTIPSKTYSYLACGRPILVAAKGEVADLIKEIDAGFVVPPEDPQRLIEMIQMLLNMDHEKLEKYGHNGLLAYQNNFDKKILISRYDQLIRNQI